MPLPSAAQVLDLWDGWGSATLPERAIAILDTSEPGRDPESMTVAERDRELLDLRRRVLGSTMEMVVTCPQCEEDVSFSIDADDLIESITSPPSDAVLEAARDGWRFVYRLPTTLDMSDVAATGDPERGRALLLARCLVEVSDGDTPVDPADLSEDGAAVFASVLESEFPGGELRFQVSCGECGSDWDAEFDITSYFWAELIQLAQRIITDVHLLAAGYGWRESEILEMSAQRRATYIEMLP